jgi:hypothetical protein
MSECVFNFNGENIVIQCTIDDKLLDIFNKFVTKLGKDLNDIYFIYGGGKIDENSNNLTINEIANEEDRKRNKMNILAYEIKKNIPKNNIIKSSEIICFECGENAICFIDNYKINLFGCKNGHKINNILFNEFENKNTRDESKIMCNICKKNNKANSFNRLFYKCNT